MPDKGSSAVLGVDLGTVRIGVAIREMPHLPAVPLTTLRARGWSHDLDAVARLARERGAGCIVVGAPLRMDGSAGPEAQRASAFVAELRVRFSGEVEIFDERFTTKIAAAKMRDLPGSGSKRRRHHDELAAVEILDGYVAKRNAQ